MSSRILLPPQLSAAAQAGVPAGAVVHRLAGETMGTTWSVALCAAPDLDSAGLRALLQAELDRVVAQMSHWEPDSDLMRFNTAAAGSTQVLPEPFWTVLATAIDLAELSAGAYDPAAGALVDLWGFGAHPRPQPGPPGDADIRAALARCGWRRLAVDRERRCITQAGGVALDLSSIAKGHGVDRLCTALEAAGIPHYLAEVGGELRGQGCKPDEQPWWVTLEAIPDAAGQRLAPWMLALDGIAVATSGDYRRYFETEGRRYAHTLDPRRGHPVHPAPAAVSVVESTCMLADGMATVLTVLGLQDGMRLAEQLGIAALFAMRESGGIREYASSAWTRLLAA